MKKNLSHLQKSTDRKNILQKENDEKLHKILKTFIVNNKHELEIVRKASKGLVTEIIVSAIITTLGNSKLGSKKGQKF